MARCKLTNMNLRTIRKSREYQALLIDLVAIGVVGQSAAENILGYTIPAGLLGSSPVTDDDDEEQGSGGSGGDDTGDTVTLLYFNSSAKLGEWETETFTLADDTTEADIIAAAKTAFEVNDLDATSFAQLNPEYVEGESELSAKYIDLDPQPEAYEDGQLILVFNAPQPGGAGKD